MQAWPLEGLLRTRTVKRVDEPDKKRPELYNSEFFQGPVQKEPVIPLMVPVPRGLPDPQMVGEDLEGGERQLTEYRAHGLKFQGFVHKVSTNIFHLAVPCFVLNHQLQKPKFDYHH